MHRSGIHAILAAFWSKLAKMSAAPMVDDPMSTGSSSERAVRVVFWCGFRARRGWRVEDELTPCWELSRPEKWRQQSSTFFPWSQNGHQDPIYRFQESLTLKNGNPPRMRVAPPWFGSSMMLSTRAPVKVPMIA
jgi:hypothetical protein